LLGADTGSHTVHKRQRNDERQHQLSWSRTRISWHGYRQKHCVTQRGTGTPASGRCRGKPIRDDLEQPFGDTKDIKEYATPKQRGMIRARAFDKNLTNTELLLHINKVTDSAFSSIEALSKQQASQVIESLGN
jgi:hypothetical protein